jgi:hypothetical protein
VKIAYLKKNGKAIAQSDIKYSFRAGHRNHAVKDSSLPKRMALAEDIVVMLLRNEIVEVGLRMALLGPSRRYCTRMLMAHVDLKVSKRSSLCCC